MKKLTGLIVGAMAEVARLSKEVSLDLAKIKALTYYLEGVQKVRSVCVFIFLLFFALMVFTSGFILTHVAFLFYAPWSPGIKFLIVFLLGAAYAVTAGFFFLSIFSQKRWMEISKAEKFMEQVLDKK